MNKRGTAGALAGALILLFFVACNDSGGGISGTINVIGTGPTQLESRSVSNFTRIDHTSVGELRIEQGANTSLTVEAQANVLPYIETEVVGSTLRIGTADRVSFQLNRVPVIEVTVPTLTSLHRSGVGSISCAALTATDFELVTSGVGGTVIDNLDASSLVTTMSGVGRVLMSGRVDTQTVIVGDLNDYEAAGLSSVSADVTLSSAGSATVRVSDTLDVTITGSGTLSYWGDPIVNSTITGTGTVVRLGP